MKYIVKHVQWIMISLLSNTRIVKICFEDLMNRKWWPQIPRWLMLKNTDDLFLTFENVLSRKWEKHPPSVANWFEGECWTVIDKTLSCRLELTINFQLHFLLTYGIYQCSDVKGGSAVESQCYFHCSFHLFVCRYTPVFSVKRWLIIIYIWIWCLFKVVARVF